MSFIARIAPPRAVHWLRSIPFIAQTDASSFIEMTTTYIGGTERHDEILQRNVFLQFIFLFVEVYI